MKIFTHTSAEKGLWRGWIRNGQSIELSLGKCGWDFGVGVHIHSDDGDNASRMLFLKFWRFTAVIPLGISPGPLSIDDEPQWSAYVSSEFGMTAQWGRRRWQRDYPWSFDWHRTSYLLNDGTWVHEMRHDRPGVNKSSPYENNYAHYQHICEQREGREWRQPLPYKYTKRNGVVQNVTATVTVREYERRRRFLRWTWVGAKIERSIDVTFSDEVGESSGSWKGGTIGCSYGIKPGETPEQCLRRMEMERMFR